MTAAINGPTIGMTSPVPKSEYYALCALVFRVFPVLQWRHSGLGVLQAYVDEHGPRELRVHVWHPDLRRPGIEESGLAHDHRFDMASYVLVGGLLQREIVLNEGGGWALYEVPHARLAQEQTAGKSFHLEPTRLPGTFERRTRDWKIKAGTLYTFPRRSFHETHFGSTDGPTVTLVVKKNQADAPARILAPIDKPLVHAFEKPLPESYWLGPLQDARARLFDQMRMK